MPPKRCTAPGPALYAASALATSPPKVSSCCLRYFAPPLMDCTGSSTLVTPRPAAVAGISCARPRAPAGEPALGLKPDSCLIRPASNAGSRPLDLAAAVISAANGVPEGSSLTVAVGVAAAVTAVCVERVDGPELAFASWVEKDFAATGGATGAPCVDASSACNWPTRLMTASRLMR